MSNDSKNRGRIRACLADAGGVVALFTLLIIGLWVF